MTLVNGAFGKRPKLQLRFECVIASGLLALGLMQARPTRGQILISTSPRPAFEVATIKPSKADAPEVKTRTYRGNFMAEHASLVNLLKFAYRVKSEDQLVGLPGWSDTEFFDVNAKVDEQTLEVIAKLPLDEMMRQTRLRVQSLLAERFHLSVTTRKENREVYALVVAKDGPRLREVESSALASANAPRNGEVAAPPPPPPSTPVRPLQTALDYSQRGKLTGKAASIDMLAQWLSTQQEVGDLTVLNETGLGGRYDFSLTSLSVSETNVPSQVAEPQASVFTLIREQLGLQLKSKSALIEVLVIETAERPSAN